MKNINLHNQEVPQIPSGINSKRLVPIYIVFKTEKNQREREATYPTAAVPAEPASPAPPPHLPPIRAPSLHSHCDCVGAVQKVPAGRARGPGSCPRGSLGEVSLRSCLLSKPLTGLPAASRLETGASCCDSSDVAFRAFHQRTSGSFTSPNFALPR